MSFTLPDRVYGGYLFDCDGTLVDSMPLHYAGWGHALEKLGIDFVFPHDLFESLGGMATNEIVALLNQRFELAIDHEALMTHKRAYFVDQVENIGVLEDVVAEARRIAEIRPVAIVTGGMRHIVTQSLTATGLLELFPVIVTFQDVPNGKPAPDMFLLAAEKIGVPPEDCLVIEDGELGVQGANAAGMDAVLVR